MCLLGGHGHSANWTSPAFEDLVGRHGPSVDGTPLLAQWGEHGGTARERLARAIVRIIDGHWLW